MAYDSPKYQVRSVMGPIFCSVAAALKLTAANATQVGSSAATIDRLQFFRKIKITGFSVRTRSGAAANAHALSLAKPEAKLLHGTVTVATAMLGTVADVYSAGGLASGTYLQLLTGTDTLKLAYKMSPGAAIGTHAIITAAAQSFDAFIEYQEKL
jgi:hypothetical protein